MACVPKMARKKIFFARGIQYCPNFSPTNFDIVISSQVLFHDGSLLHSKIQYTTLDYSSQHF
jgi:hypothetical protein